MFIVKSALYKAMKNVKIKIINNISAPPNLSTYLISEKKKKSISNEY